MNATILIVDDEKNTREGLREALEHLGYLAITARDGLQAEDLLRRQAWSCSVWSRAFLHLQYLS